MKPLKSADPETILKQARVLSRKLEEGAAERDARGGTPKAERDLIRASGLLNLMIPQEFGGLGAGWLTTVRVQREIGKADGSLAHVFGYHQGEVILPHLLGTRQQKEDFYRQSAANNWFCGNASSEHVPRLIDWKTSVRPDGNGYLLNGVKHFCSGAKDSDRLFVFAGLEGEENLFQGLCVAVIPSDRAGVTINADWDNMGQRQTDSGSVVFDNVRIEPDEMLGAPGSFFATTFSSLWPMTAQLVIGNVYLGIALGAFETAKSYTRSTTRAWPASGVEKASQDAFIIQKYGNMWIDLSAAILATDHAAALLDKAWAKELAVTPEERAEVSIAVSIAKALNTRVSLDVTSKMFEVMGARATAAKGKYDRFWRNARTHTLHDPVEYKIREVGNWILNDEPPMPTFTS